MTKNTNGRQFTLVSSAPNWRKLHGSPPFFNANGLCHLTDSFHANVKENQITHFGGDKL
jgi:hypothetical protein